LPSWAQGEIAAPEAIMSVRSRGFQIGIAALATGCYSGLEHGSGGVGDAGVDSAAEGGDAGDDSAGDSGGDTGDADPEAACEVPTVDASPLRRLTRLEYDNTVRDLLGVTHRPAYERLGPDEASAGFHSNGVAPISATTLDVYVDIAEEIAPLGFEQRSRWIDCDFAEVGCPDAFVEAFGRQAFRRPLTDAEITDYVALYESSLSSWDVETAVALVVQSMLLSPAFLYHLEPMPAGAEETDVVAMGEYELASRLSYFLYVSMPDEALFDAAAAGTLSEPGELEAQVRRMLADDRAADTIASFHRQWLHIDDIDDRVKDSALFPAWDAALADAMALETASFADEVIRRGDHKLQTLLTADWTLGDASLAELYGVAAPGTDGRIDLDPQERSGVLTQAAFLTAQAHAAEVSWVYRGKFVRENLLCDELQPPPPGVEVNETNDPSRLEDPQCSGCHALMDPIGRGFDNYDAIGAFRLENDEGQSVDAQGDVLGHDDIGTFENAVDLSRKLAAAPVVHDCMALQWFRYAMRRLEGEADQCAIDDIVAQFEESEQDIAELIVAIVSSDAFRYRRSANPE
jgi:hypothetical protein